MKGVCFSMKTGTITFFRKNYGAVLQAYALQTVLKSLGHTNEIMDYEDNFLSGNALFSKWTDVKEVILNFFTLLRYKSFVKRKKRMLTFQKENMKVSSKRYLSSRDFEKNVSEYDAFICGSDQIWGAKADNDRNRIYFLGFIEQDQAIKISYGPSFGVSTIPKQHSQIVKPWINDIRNLSVREKTGKEIIEQVTGRQANIVLDPTLLLESKIWDSVAKQPSIKEPYILVYSTSQRGLFPKLVKHIKKKTRLPVVVLSLYSLNLIPGADHVIYDAGPKEFIGLFANASCVCTNSFHGTAFSIIYRKPFWSVPHNTTNSRMADLLNRIELSCRQVANQGDFPELPLEIDYSGPVSKIKQYKKESIDFLQFSFDRS